MKVKFLLAEEVRPELSGKQTVIGLFADDVLIVGDPSQPKEALSSEIPFGIDRLTFLINVTDAEEGPYQFKARILDPSGQDHGPEIILGDAVMIEKGTSKTFILEAKPFMIKEKGVYQYVFLANDKPYSFPFEIRDNRATT